MPLHIRGIAASLVCDGHELPQYSEEEVDATTRTCYVPSQAGKEFTVKCENTSPHLMTWIASLDGRYKQKLRMEPGAQKYIRSLCNVPREERPFIFSQLEVSDASHDNPPHLDKLGWIEVVACRVKVTGAPPHTRTRRVSLPPEIGPLPERSKKDGWHAVALGKARASKHRAAPPVKYLDSWDKPFAKFCFRYQPAALLRAHGIMPPSLNQSREDSDDSFERERVRRAQDLKDIINSSQAELAAMEADRIKREGSPIMLAGGSGEVIDLTLDDDD